MYFVSDICSANLADWKQGDTVILEMQTGSGKTFFITNFLLPYAIQNRKNILYICNRMIVLEQQKGKIVELENLQIFDVEGIYELGGITLMTYQKLQKIMKNSINNVEKNFDYVVFDEIHYLFSDALFNPEVSRVEDFMRKTILKCRIFISATMEDVTKRIINAYGRLETQTVSEYLTIAKIRTGWELITKRENQLWWYHMPQQKKSLEVFCYSDLSQIVDLICKDFTDEKWLIFTSNKEKSFDYLIGKVQDESFDMISSEEKGGEIFQDLISEEAFSKKILLATKVIDNGVNIKDVLLKNLVLDSTNKADFLQMLGRKRMKEGETVKIYLPKKTVNYFNALLQMRFLPTNEALEKISGEEGKVPISSQIKILIDKDLYHNVKDFMFERNGHLYINQIGKQILEEQIKFCENQIKGLKEDSLFFIKTQLSWLGMDYGLTEINDLDDIVRREGIKELSELLAFYSTSLLDGEKQNAFRSKWSHIVQKYGLSPKGKGIPGKKKINDFCKNVNLPYEIKSIGGKRKGEKTLWKIKSICHATS